jgi:hypothetical protein
MPFLLSIRTVFLKKAAAKRLVGRFGELPTWAGSYPTRYPE